MARGLNKYLSGADDIRIKFRRNKKSRVKLADIMSEYPTLKKRFCVLLAQKTDCGKK